MVNKELEAQEWEDKARLAIKEKDYDLALSSYLQALECYKELNHPGNIGIITKEIKRVENLKELFSGNNNETIQKIPEQFSKIELEKKATNTESQIRRYISEDKLENAITAYHELEGLYNQLNYEYQVRKVKYEIEKLTNILNKRKTMVPTEGEDLSQAISIAEERRKRLEEERRMNEEAELLRQQRAEEEYVARKLREEEELKNRQESIKQAKEQELIKAKEEALKKAKEEEERKAKEEALKKAKEVELQPAKEDPLQKAKDERIQKAKEEIMRKVREEVEARRLKEAAKKGDNPDQPIPHEENPIPISALNLSPADLRRRETEEKEKRLKELQKKKEMEDQLVSDGETKLNQAKKAVDRHEFDIASKLYEEAAKIFRQLGWTQQVEVLVKEAKNVQDKKQKWEEHLKAEEEAKRRQDEKFEERARKILEEKEKQKQLEEEAKKKLSPEILRKMETADFVLQKAKDLEEKQKFGKALGRYEYLLELYTELSIGDDKKAPIIEKIQKLKEIPGINEDSD